MDTLFFIATPAVGEYYFLHTREIKPEYKTINDFISKRGTHGAACFCKEDAEAIIRVFIEAGIVGADKYRLISMDSIFGFLREQVVDTDKPKKQIFKPLKAQRHEHGKGSFEQSGTYPYHQRNQFGTWETGEL